MITKEPKFRTARHAYEYAMRNNCRLNQKNEKLISTVTEFSYYYAFKILKNRFRLGEEVISKSPAYSFYYVYGILNSSPPVDFLELCSVEVLNYLLNNRMYWPIDNIIKILFKKKLLNHE